MVKGVIVWGAFGTRAPFDKPVSCECGQDTTFCHLIVHSITKFDTVILTCPHCNKILATVLNWKKWQWRNAPPGWIRR
jgi:hypothetical protein